MGLALNEIFDWKARADGCVFFGLSDERKSGRQVDDFLISGPHASVDTMASTMDLRDVVALCDIGSSGILVGMDIEKTEGRSSLRLLASHVDGMETAKPSKRRT